MANRDEQALEKIEFAKDQVIGAVSETMDLYGVTPSAGTLYATMYFNEQMSLDEMRDELNMSKPSMSTGVRKLQENGMVKRIFQRGTRKHLYRAEKDFFESFMSFYCKMWEREVKMNLEAIETAKISLNEVIADDKVSSEIRNQTKEHLDLLDHSKVYYEWLSRLVDSVRSEEIFKFLPKGFNEQIDD